MGELSISNSPKLLQSENSYSLLYLRTLSENLSEDLALLSELIFIVGTFPIVCDVGSSGPAFPAAVLDQQKNDVIRRYTKQVILFILFLATETDRRVNRK